jgi:hypothetical protein
VGAVRAPVDGGMSADGVTLLGRDLMTADAIAQLSKFAAMPYVRAAAGMPDLHAGAWR